MQKFYNLILFLTFVYCISCDVFSKEYVLSLVPQKCTVNNDCTNGTNSKSYCSKEICHTTYFCHNNECIEEQEGMSFNQNISINDYKNATTTDLIMESCPEEARKLEVCFTRFCTEDSNCFSNKCVNNTCTINESFTTNICYFDDETSNMQCFKPDLESCEKDGDCEKYHSCNKHKFCEAKIDSTFHYVLQYTFYILPLLIVALIAIACYYCIKRRNENKNHSHSNSHNNSHNTTIINNYSNHNYSSNNYSSNNYGNNSYFVL